MKYDTAIIGAGSVGSALAIGLRNQGISVALIDRKEKFPPNVFRAERASGCIVGMFQELGAWDCIEEHVVATPVIANYRNSSRLHFTEDSNDIAFHYSELTRALQKKAMAEADFFLGEVRTVERSNDAISISTANGQTVQARSLVIASGVDRTMQKMLGLDAEILAKNFSFAYGGNIVLMDRKTLDFTNAVYWNHKTENGTAYMNVFQLRDCIRYNFFTYWAPKDPRHRRLMSGAESFLEVMDEVCPELKEVIGNYSVNGRPQGVNISLSRIHQSERAGVFLAGDASGRSCPARGMGLLKGINDAVILSSQLPRELLTRSGVVETESVLSYNGDRRKTEMDDLAEQGSLKGRDVAIGDSLTAKLKKTRIQMTPGWAFKAILALRYQSG